MNDHYNEQVRLLLRVLPIIAERDYFALKGGTAINFFWRNSPRLSVDIDLTYLPIKDRSESLQEIRNGVQQIADQIEVRFPNATVTRNTSGGTLSKLIIRTSDAQIKVEVNTVLRGTIFDPVEQQISSRIQDEFELFVATQTLSMEDLFGGKICVALDRQHPRDLYDIKVLLENEGITKDIRTAFIGYLISHSRPIHEILNPNRLDLKEIYRNEFVGMTHEKVSIEELRDIQKRLPRLLLQNLTKEKKEFLISFQQVNPKWNLIPVPHLRRLPGVRWKLINLNKMDQTKHQAMGEKLKNLLTG